MPVTRRPQTPRVDVDALIEKGGTPPARQPSKADKPSYVQLRLTPDLLAQIDAAVAGRPVKVPRHQWLLEAVMEKLARNG